MKGFFFLKGVNEKNNLSIVPKNSWEGNDIAIIGRFPPFFRISHVLAFVNKILFLSSSSL